MTISRSTSTSGSYTLRGQSMRPAYANRSEPAAAGEWQRTRKGDTRKWGRRIALAALAGAALIAAVLAASSVSHAAAIRPIESGSRQGGPAPGHMPCPAAAPIPAAGYAPANGCVSGLPLNAALAQLARGDQVAGSEAAAQERRVQHPGARHPEAVLYEIRDGERQLLVIDLWCLPTIQKPVGVRRLC